MDKGISEALAVSIENMSPYITDLLDPITLKEGGITFCEYALKEYPPVNDIVSDETRELAHTLLEAFGYIEIPSDLPLICGHKRNTKPSEKLYHHDLCNECENKKKRKTK